MNSYQFEELRNLIKDASKLVSQLTNDETLKETLNDAYEMTVQMQMKSEIENENLELIGVYPESINKVVEICEEAVKAVDEEVNAFYDTVAIEDAKDAKDITNAFVDEMLLKTQQLLNGVFEANDLDIDVDFSSNGEKSYLSIGGEEVISGHEVQKAILTAIKELMKDTLEKFNIPEIPDSLTGKTMNGTVENIMDYITNHVKELETAKVTMWGSAYQIDLYQNGGKCVAEKETIGTICDALEKVLEQSRGRG